MLFLLHGLNGSGKSYHAVKDFLIPALKAGRPVITNLDGLNFDYIEVNFEIPRENMAKIVYYPPPEDLFEAGTADDPMTSFYYQARKLPNALIIFDEIQAYYPSLAWKENPHRTAFSSYITQHRKLGQDFVALTPDFNKVDSSIRSIFHFNLHFKKAAFLGQDSRYFVNFRYGSDFIGKPFKTSTGVYTNEYHACYKSLRVDKEGETKYTRLRYVPKPLIAGALASLLGFAYAGYNWHKSKQAKSVSVAQTTPAADAPAAGLGGGRPDASKLVMESHFRLAGYLSESPGLLRLYGCDGETIGFSTTDPTESGSSWASCADRDTSDGADPEPGAL